MAGAKEIRSKIASVQNTQKITKAMEMVAAGQPSLCRYDAQSDRSPCER